MPYNHPKITYGLPGDPHNQELTRELVEDLQMALGMKKRVVGVKLFFDQGDYEACADPELKNKLPYCTMVEKASRGQAHKSRLEQHNCDGGTTALGLEKSSEHIECGAEYYSYNLYKTPAAASRMRQSILSLHRLQLTTCGITVKPLEDFTITPDVVICVVNPYQAMRIMQGYVYHTGIKPTCDIGGMQAMCSEITVVPYLTGKINLSVMCPSTRMLCRWKDEDMAAGIPFECFQQVVEGVIATINSTDLKKDKEAIIARFQAKGKSLPLDLISK